VQKLISVAVIFGLSSLFGASTAQAQLKLTFPSGGMHRVWVSSATPDQKILGTPTSEKTVTISEAELAKGDVVKVLDVATNNLAQKSKKDAGTAWELKETDYTRLGKILVLSFDESHQPVMVTAMLKFGTESATLMMDSSGDGAFIIGALPGKVTATCSYMADGQTKQGPTVTYDFPLKRPMADMTVGLVVAGKVAPLPAEPKKAEPAKSKSDSSESTPSPASEHEGGTNWFAYVAVLAVGAGIVYALTKYLPQNRKLIEEKLAKVGMQLPSDEPPAPDPVPVAPKQAPVEKIILDPASDPAPVASVAGAVLNPRLVDGSGGVLLLLEGQTVIGREEGPDVTQVADQTLSRRHAEIQRRGDTVSLKDLGSTNGTYRNNQKLTDSAVTLVPGDTIQFGGVRYRYEV
jgi:hypothetical protein